MLAVSEAARHNETMSRSASSEDYAHFAAIARAEEVAEEERIDRAVKTPPGERMVMGVRLDAAMKLTPQIVAEIDARADGQMELARRRIALGLTDY